MRPSTYFVTSNDEWRTARRVARPGDSIIVITWKHPIGSHGLRYTLDLTNGLTGPTATTRQPGTTAWTR